MKQQRFTNRYLRRQKKAISSGRPGTWAHGIEQLEDRYVLAANILASTLGTVSVADGTQSLDMNVAIAGGAADDSAMLMIHVSAADGSSLDPLVPQVMNSAGDSMSATSSKNDSNSSGIIVSLPAGDYQLQVGAENGTLGSGNVEVSLLGDVGGSVGVVDTSDSNQAMAAMTQGFGSANFVTELFYQSLGIDLSLDQYDAGFDSNGDGVITQSEFAAIQANTGLGTVSIDFSTDTDGPVISSLALANDTGISGTDGITTDPTITGQVSDNAGVASLLGGIDAAPSFELSDVVDAGGNFTLDLAKLAETAGGTLSAGAHTLRLSATDSLGNTSGVTEFQFTYLTTSTAPTTSGISNQIANEGDLFSLDVTSSFSDSDTGDVLMFSSNNLPAWLSIANGLLTGTAAATDIGTATVTVTAEDSQGLTVASTFDINVNGAPVLSTIPSQSATEDAPFTLDVSPFATDSESITFSATLSDGSVLPDWLTFNSAGLFVGTPTNDDVGTITIFLMATDSLGASAMTPFDLNVANTNDAPEVANAISDTSVPQDVAMSIDLSNTFSDPDVGDVLTLTVVESGTSGLPAWLSFDAGTSVLSGTPGNSDVGTLMLVATATDIAGLTATDEFNIAVGQVNDPPIPDPPIPNQEVDQDASFSLAVPGFFSDPDGDSLTFDATQSDGSPLPDWLTLDGSNLLAGTPTNADVGTLNIRVTATDTGGLEGINTFGLTVNNINDAPTLVTEIPQTQLNEGSTLNLDISSHFNDIDAGDTLAFTSTALPGWLTLSGSGVFFGTAGSSDVGTTTITVTATDTSGADVSDSFDLTVNDVQLPPIIADQQFTVADDAPNDTVIGTVTASDPDGDPVTLTIISGNTGGALALDSSSGELTVANATALAGLTQIVLQVEASDGALTDTADITVDVESDTMIAARFTLSVVDDTGAPITQVETGGSFELVVTVQDKRDDPTGVFAAYLDVAFDDSLVTVDTIDHGATYTTLAKPTSGTALSPAGGLGPLSSIGGDSFEVFRAEMTVGSSPGNVFFIGNQPDNQSQDGLLFYLETTVTDPTFIDFGTTSVEIVGPAAALSSSINTNLANPSDVNEDGQVTPLDALLVINNLETGQETGKVDVNADGTTSPLDILLVLNSLEKPQAALSAGIPQASMSAGLQRAEPVVVETSNAAALERFTPVRDAYFASLTSDDAALRVDHTLTARSLDRSADRLRQTSANDTCEFTPWAEDLADDLSEFN